LSLRSFLTAALRPGAADSDAIDSSAAAASKNEPLTPVSPIGYKMGVESVYSPKPIRRKSKKQTEGGGGGGGDGSGGSGGGGSGGGDGVVSPGGSKVAPITTQSGSEQSKVPKNGSLKPFVKGVILKKPQSDSAIGVTAAISGSGGGGNKKERKKPPRTGQDALARSAGDIRTMSTAPESAITGSGGSGVIRSLRSFQGVSSTIMNINKIFTLGKKEDTSNKYRVHQHAHFTRNIYSQADFRPDDLGLTAFAMGPFMEKAMVFHLSPKPNLTLAAGRFEVDAAFTNDIRFQDHSVGMDACEMIFKKNRGYRLKCADPAGVAVAYLDDEQEPHCQLVADQEEIDLSFCSAIRFGRHSWVTLTPFVPSVLLLHGRYTRQDAEEGRYEKMAAYISKPFSLIGNGAGNDVNFPGFNVGEKHCHIFKTEAGFMIVDGNTKAGTYINGIRLLPPTGMLLFPGACITFGPPEHHQELVVHVNANLDQHNKCDWVIEVDEQPHLHDG